MHNSFLFYPTLAWIFVGGAPPMLQRGHLDSADTRKHAEQMQQSFERTRWEYLPWGYGGSGPCDLRIGRYCFTFDDGRDWDPPPDDPTVVAARERLVRSLDSLRAIIPGDEWILTQLVRYSVDLERFDIARKALSPCPLAKSWLCHALSGFANHIREDYTAAEVAFDSALAQMPSETRCEWEDISDLLTGGVRRSWRDRDCHTRGAMLDTLFWLADPLYSVAGNELRTEHFARHVASLMYKQARGPDRERWNPTLHKIIMRYGWPTGWERVREYRTSLRPPMITHYGLEGSATFLPTTDVLDEPTAVAEGTWDTDPERPQSSHSPTYARETFGTLAVQWAMFRRRDSTTLVGVTSLSHEALSRNDEITFAMAFSTGPHPPPLVSTSTTRDTSQVLVATLPAFSHLVSFEARVPSVGVAARSRFGLDMRRVHGAGLGISDIVVLEPVDSLPNALPDAVQSLRLPRPYRAGERFVLYWELYGATDQTTYSTSLTLDKTSKGIFRRLAEITPFASHQPAVRVAWDDATPDFEDTITRSLAVDLPRELSNGRYRLTLTIEGSDGEQLQRFVDLDVISGT